MKKKIVLPIIVVGCCVGVVLIGAGFWRIPAKRISPTKFEQIFDEITSLEVSIASLTPDFGGKTLAYVHSTDSGRGLAMLDLQSLERMEVSLPNEVTQISGWSPDGRYLAFLQVVPPNPRKKGELRETWITLYDRQTGSIKRLTQDKNAYETYFFWLSETNYMYSRRWLTNDYGEFVIGSIGVEQVKKVSNFIPEGTIMSSNRAGFLYHGNILELEIKPLADYDKGTAQTSRTVRQLTEFKPEDFTEMKWLRYAPRTGKLLFCGKPAKSNWRYLFQVDPVAKQLTQLSHEDTYNGQWLQGGAGFAYVGNRSNSFYLAVRTKDPSQHTNLFTRGTVVSYSASPDGNRIYVYGAVGEEPQGIWEYNLTSRNLRPVVSGMKKGFAASRIIQPEAIRVKSSDGLEIPCFLLTPPVVSDMAKTNRPGWLSQWLPRAKYPAVIYIPPPSSQMQKSFGPRSQFLANIGFYFLAVNYRGVDGYGREYSSKGSMEGILQDVLAAYQWLIKNPNVDRKNVFVFSMSGGTDICMEVLASAPELWRGMAIDKPDPFVIDKRFDPGKLPPLLLVTGSQDTSLNAVQRFASWAASNHVEVVTSIYTNATHFTFDLNSRKRSQKEVAEFYLKHLQ